VMIFPVNHFEDILVNLRPNHLFYVPFNAIYLCFPLINDLENDQNDPRFLRINGIDGIESTSEGH